MGMSIHIVGVRAPDEKWKKMKAAYESCVAAGVPIPSEVSLFFNGEPPSNLGVEVCLDRATAFVHELNEESRHGFILDLKELAKHPVQSFTHIKFFNQH